MRRSILTILFAAVAGFAAACQSTEAPKPAPNTTPAQTTPSPSPSATGSPAASPSVDPKASPGTPSAKVTALEGKWTGVEGTALTVTKNGEKYKVEVTGLDKKTETFDGIAKGDTIEFIRKGKTETIKTATGEETGMKYLLTEKNCVVVNKGSEGYCRK